MLSDADISRAVTRIAHEIVESPRRAPRLILLGIPTRGATLAARLAGVINEISAQDVEWGTLDVTLYRDDLDRNPLRTPQQSRIPETGIDDATVILVDDVLNSGRTIRAAFDALADVGRARNVKLAVLVDRGHRDFPIRADFVGKNIPSNEGERVRVHLAETDGDDYVVVTDS